MSEPDGAGGTTLAGLVGLALTGVELPLAAARTPGEIVSALASAGWDGARIGALREARVGAGERWPLPVTAQHRSAVGAAQLHAATQAVIAELGLGARPRLRDQHAELSPRDRILLADRPPHHGPVG